jgi:hypothetical protein
LWHDVATSGALDPSLEAHDIFASGVSAKHSRKLSVELQRELVDMGVYSKDIHTTLASYTHQMIKRVVEQSRFGGYEVGDDGKFKTTEDGKYLYHPMARLKHQLEVSSMLKGSGSSFSKVSSKDFARVRDVYLPALRGTLGGNIDPNYNAIISWTQLGLNIAMLPLSVTSSFADLGGIGVMREVYKHPIQALSDMKKVARYFLDGQRREQLQRAAKVMGIVNGHAIDHVLSESMSMDHMNLTPKKINEKFFEFIQMKRWTNFSRILATDFAIDTLRDLVKNPNDSLRDELSLSTADLNTWMNSGGDLSAAEALPAIRHAIARWVDMAILRPEAALRPPVGSDRRFALFWHLKEYMYSFYYTTMRRVWEQTKHEEGLSRALPGIALGVFAFTLASAGYELRKLLAEELAPRALGITPNYRRPDFMGEDYMYEMMLRGGLLGPFTVLHDMYSADKHGSLAITGLMGPAFAKLVEAMDDGIAPTLVTTTPLLAQSGTLRAAAKDYLDM